MCIYIYICTSLCRWVTECGDIFRSHKQYWAHLIPNTKDKAPILAEHFFSTACSLMARQLRETVMHSLEELIVFLSIYKEGNDYEESFSDFIFVSNPVSMRSSPLIYVHMYLNMYHKLKFFVVDNFT